MSTAFTIARNISSTPEVDALLSSAAVAVATAGMVRSSRGGKAFSVSVVRTIEALMIGALCGLLLQRGHASIASHLAWVVGSVWLLAVCSVPLEIQSRRHGKMDGVHLSTSDLTLLITTRLAGALLAVAFALVIMANNVMSLTARQADRDAVALWLAQADWLAVGVSWTARAIGLLGLAQGARHLAVGTRSGNIEHE